MAWHVVIAGGGFGGFYAARTLERVLPPQSTRVTLVSDVNFMLYTPLLPGAAAGTLEPRHVVVPLREALDRTHLRIGAVGDADPHRNIGRLAPPPIATSCACSRSRATSRSSPTTSSSSRSGRSRGPCRCRGWPSTALASS